MKLVRQIKIVFE